MPGGARAERPEFALLEETQEFHLGRQRQGVDLIEEESAAFRVVEQPAGRRARAGESAGFVTKQLVLDQLGGDRAAIHRDERLARPASKLVDGTGAHFFAGAGFTGNQDGRVAMCQLRNLAERLYKSQAAAHQLLETQGLLQLLKERVRARRAERPAHHARQQVLQSQRREAEIGGAKVEEAVKVFRRPGFQDGEDGKFAAVIAQRLEEAVRNG